MISLVSSLLLSLTGIVAGIIGALTGLGGAVIITPVLSILFGVPLEYAAGASLVATIATSSGSAVAYIKDKVTNIRIGMSLEIATTAGAIFGALAAAFVYSHNLAYLIFIAFGSALLLSIYPTLKNRNFQKKNKPDHSTEVFQLRGSYYDKAEKKTIAYSGVRWWLGEGIMFIAGTLSGLLGVGSGVLKVLAMDSGMRLPIKVSTATSNFMIGVTAVTGSAIYWGLGYIRPFLVTPVIIGVLIGAAIGTRIMQQQQGSKVRTLFIIILAIISVEMILKGLGIA